MDRGKVGVNKLRASTILEVIIALVILMIVFAIALTIFNNVFHISLSIKKIKAEAELQNVLISIEQSGDYSENTEVLDDLKVIKKIQPLENEPSLLSVHLTAVDVNGIIISELNQLIMNRHAEP